MPRARPITRSITRSITRPMARLPARLRAALPATCGASAAAMRRALPAAALRLAALAGGRCAACRAWCRGALCAACDAESPWPDDAGSPAAGPGPEPIAHIVAGAAYAPPWDALVAALKFGSRPELAAPLARRLACAVDTHRSRGAGHAVDVDLVVPVPLGPRRLRERGYNQAWEIARRVAAPAGLAALPHALRRVRETGRQHALPRSAREQNLRDAFEVDPAARSRVRGARIALVDDVLTTGATARAAASALADAGAHAVVLWVATRKA